jgi:antitoxin (DNA-binding transcriptional repressor) of toxin-antitoxin stability system
MKATNVSDLKQHLSARLQAVRTGATLVVTDRHVPIAVLAPLPAGIAESGFASLVAAGAMAPPRQPLDAARFRALPRARWKPGLSPAVAAERDGR